MKVAEAAARTMLVSMGDETSADCSPKKLVGRLNDLATRTAELQEPAEEIGLFKSISKALEEGDTIELEASTTSEEPEKEKPMNAEKNGKTNPKASKRNGSKGKDKTSPKKTTDRANVDRFGSRLGTEYAKLNSAISKKPRTVTELVEAAGIKPKVFKSEKKKEPQLGGYYVHMRKLTEKGFVKKTDEGYVIVGK